jgi:general secretion pathway protein I
MCDVSKTVGRRLGAIDTEPDLAQPTAYSLLPTARGTRRAAGFTLIEVLAALIIISLGMLGVIEAVSQTARNDAYLRDKTIAHWVAMNQLTKARLETRAPRIDKSSDEVEMAQRRWRWTMAVTQTAVDTVRRIDISVTPAEASKDSSLARVTGFYGTAITPVAQPLPWGGQGIPGQNPPTPDETPTDPDPTPDPEEPNPVSPPPPDNGDNFEEPDDIGALE